MSNPYMTPYFGTTDTFITIPSITGQPVVNIGPYVRLGKTHIVKYHYNGYSTTMCGRIVPMGGKYLNEISSGIKLCKTCQRIQEKP